MPCDMIHSGRWHKKIGDLKVDSTVELQKPPGLHEMQLAASAVNQSQTVLVPQCFSVSQHGASYIQSRVMHGPFVSCMEYFVELSRST